MAKDILNSPHLYDTDVQPYCAWTNDPNAQGGLDAIHLSLPVCGPFLESSGRPYAIKTLIHESVHHLLRNLDLRRQYNIVFTGTDQEQYDQQELICNEVAEAVERSFEKVAQEGIPHWRDISIEHQGMEERGFHTGLWTGQTNNPRSTDKMIIWGGCKETEEAIYGCATYFNDGGIYAPATDTWERTSVQNAPEGRIYHAALWTGQAQDPNASYKMIVWGGCTEGNGCTRELADGGIYDPASDTWRLIPSGAGAPSQRSHHSGVWDGQHFIVWGGSFGTTTPNVQPQALGDGGLYNVTTGQWQAIATVDAKILKPRSFHSALWTGETGNPITANKMLVWGGCDIEDYRYCRNYYNDGALFDPKTGTWQPLQTIGTPPSPRRLHTMVYVPEQQVMIIWGGEFNERYLNDGAFLNLKTLEWRRVMMPGPEHRSRHTAVWTGEEMLIFGGEISIDDYAVDIGAYSLPAGDGGGSWRDVQGEYFPLKVKNHSAVWTGKAMIVWGGQTGDRAFENVGAAFYPGYE